MSWTSVFSAAKFQFRAIYDACHWENFVGGYWELFPFTLTGDLRCFPLRIKSSYCVFLWTSLSFIMANTWFRWHVKIRRKIKLFNKKDETELGAVNLICILAWFKSACNKPNMFILDKIQLSCSSQSSVDFHLFHRFLLF